MGAFANYCLIMMAFLLGQTNAASFQGLDSLVEQTFSDTTSVIRLADEEKFSIPLNGRYISYDIKYSPESASNCVFREPRVEYKKLAESSKLFDQDDEIIGALVLKRQQKIVLADAYYNMVIYSTDEHKLLRLLSPKTSLISSNSKGSRQMVNSLALLTTQQEDYIYYLSPRVSFVFSSKSFGTQMEKINIVFPQIQKAIYYKSYIVILTPEDGTHVYKLNKTSHQIEKIQTIKNSNNHAFIDIQLDTKNQIFYILTESSIQVYRFDPSNFPNPLDPKEFVILRLADEIQLLNYTRNHGNSIPQNNQHTNLEIASTPTQIQLFVLFRHMRQNVIAEFVYDVQRQQVNFLRYFKFQMPIKQIHTIEDVIVIVGEEVLGMFPYGIDPRLIVEQFNGWISLSDIQKIVITEAPFFVGISKNTIQYGGLMFSQQAGLTCQFNESSETKVITFHGNSTWCGNRQFHSYNNYCAYTKSFILESMQIVTSSAVSSSVWIAMIVCTGAIIFGILIMLIMHKKKEDEIKKLQTYFEERKRTQIPTTSDRRTTDHKL